MLIYILDYYESFVKDIWYNNFKIFWLSKRKFFIVKYVYLKFKINGMVVY